MHRCQYGLGFKFLILLYKYNAQVLLACHEIEVWRSQTPAWLGLEAPGVSLIHSSPSWAAQNRVPNTTARSCERFPGRTPPFPPAPYAGEWLWVGSKLMPTGQRRLQESCAPCCWPPAVLPDMARSWWGTCRGLAHGAHYIDTLISYAICLNVGFRILHGPCCS